MIPSIFQSILFQARFRPGAIAISVGGNDITYPSFAGLIERVTRMLAAQDLPRDALVAVHVNNILLHWLVLLSLHRLGLASWSVTDSDLKESDVRVCVTDGTPAGLAPQARIVTASADWAGTMADSLPPFRDFDQDPDALCRAISSSGTTGRPKKVPVSYHQLNQRCLLAIPSYGLTGRVATLVGITTAVGFIFPFATWMVGGTVVLAVDLGQLHRAPCPTSIFVAPMSLSGILKQTPPDAKPIEGLTIYVGGSALPAAVAQDTLDRLTRSLIVVYGSTEIATGTFIDAAAAQGQAELVGYAVPYAQVQVVDENAQPLPRGAEGAVRIRADGMSTCYLDDPEATASAFRDGWFYPGDAGRIDARGALHVTGRVTEIINTGGVKIAPDRIDEALAQFPGVRDLAAFSVPKDGLDELWLAVVAEEGYQQDALLARYQQAFPKYRLPSIALIDAIPRNEMGKAMRMRLRQIVLNKLNQQEEK